jgi:hypothetical protein
VRRLRLVICVAVWVACWATCEYGGLGPLLVAIIWIAGGLVVWRIADA